MPKAVKPPKKGTKTLSIDLISESMREIGLNPKIIMDGRTIRSACPFRDNHRDGSGRISFFVTPSKNACHCFSCGESKSALEFMTRDLSFDAFDALEVIGDLYIENIESEEEKLYRWEVVPNREHLDDYRYSTKLPKEYLDRGFEPRLLKEFRIGTDEYSGETVIPLYQDGALVGHHYKLKKLSEFSQGFERDRWVFNEDGLDGEVAILMEGFTDVLRQIQLSDLRNCISAGFGTHFSPYHAIRLLKKGVKELALAYDNDDAGVNAQELIYLFYSNFFRISFVPYEANDPDECQTFTGGKSDFSLAYESRENYAEYQVRRYTENMDAYENIQKKAQIQFKRNKDTIYSIIKNALK